MPRPKNAKSGISEIDQELLEGVERRKKTLTKTPAILPMPRCKSSKYELSEIDQEFLEGIEQRRKTPGR